MKDKLDVCLLASRISFPVLEKINVKLRGPSSNKSRMGKWRLGLLAACLFRGMGVGFHFILPRGPFLESPGNFSGPKTHIQIEI